MADNLNSPYIHEATSENFKALVLENSERGPVLVNFWSSKGEPCLHQYPILEQLIHHYDGHILLINVDTDKEVVCAKENGITSVPTLKLFRHSQVVETMHGHQSETDLIKMLELYVTRDSDLKLADAIELFTGGKAKAAYEMIAELIVEDPVNPRLPLTMCKLLHHEGRYTEAVKLIETLSPEIRQNKEVEQFGTMLGFFAELEGAASIETLEKQLAASPDDLTIKCQFITHLVTLQQYETALDLLEQITETDPGFRDKYAQQTTLKILLLLGEGHPLVNKCQTILRRYTH